MKRLDPRSLLLALMPGIVSAAPAGKIPLTVPPGPVSLARYPLATGVPFPKGQLTPASAVRLRDGSGRAVPIQTSVLARWPDGSARSLLVVFLGGLSSSKPSTYTLEYGGVAAAEPAEGARVRVRSTATGLTVSTGALELRLRRKPFAFLDEVRLAGGTRVLAGPLDLVAVNAFDGQEYRASRDPNATLEVEESGPVRAVVRASGRLVSASGATLLHFILRLHAYAGLDFVQLDATVLDPRPEADVQAKRGPLALSVSAYGLELRHALEAPEYAFGGEGESVHSGRLSPGRDAFLYQTGRMNYDLRQGTLAPFSFAYAGAGRGSKASGWMDVSDAGSGVSAAVRNFWQQFPKELSLGEGGLRVWLHPARSSQPVPDRAYPRLSAASGYVRPNTFYSPREGLAKSYEMLFSFHAGDRARARPGDLNRAFQAEPLPLAPAAWYARSEAFGRIVEAGPWSLGFDDWLLNQVYKPSVEAFRDTGGLAVMFGWRDFGDRMRGGWCEVDPDGFKIPCFYNDTHVGAHVFFVQYLRTLDERWREYATRASRFFMDLGVSHAPRRGYWKRDYGPGEGHLIKHEIGDHTSRNLHLGHAHLSGLADLWLLTGDRRALEVTREVADWWVRAVPDFFPVPLPRPHVAEAERDFAWPLFVLNEAYRGTGDPKYHAAAARIVEHLLAWWQMPSDRLVAGRVAGRNDWRKGTGWWAMYPRCDNCPEGWNGTNPWMAGMLLSSLIYFYEHDRDRNLTDRALVKEMMLQTMNYVVKHGFNPRLKGFVYSEARPDQRGDDTLLYFPLAYLSRLYREGGLAHPERYDTAPAWWLLAKGYASAQTRAGWRGSTTSGFYGYEIGFVPEFLREVRDWK